MMPAIFLGCIFQDGDKWLGEHHWVFLDDLADKSFYIRARWSHSVRFDTESEIRFPCRALYVRDNEHGRGYPSL